MSHGIKFAHSMRLDYWKNKCRAQCCCGKQSPAFEDSVGAIARAEALDLGITGWEDITRLSKEEKARNWFEKHTGLIEKHKR